MSWTDFIEAGAPKEELMNKDAEIRTTIGTLCELSGGFSSEFVEGAFDRAVEHAFGNMSSGVIDRSHIEAVAGSNRRIVEVFMSKFIEATNALSISGYRLLSGMWRDMGGTMSWDRVDSAGHQVYLVDTMGVVFIHTITFNQDHKCNRYSYEIDPGAWANAPLIRTFYDFVMHDG